MVKLLLDYGADVNAPRYESTGGQLGDRDPCPPLHLKRTEQTMLTQTLLEHPVGFPDGILTRSQKGALLLGHQVCAHRPLLPLSSASSRHGKFTDPPLSRTLRIHSSALCCRKRSCPYSQDFVAARS